MAALGIAGSGRKEALGSWIGPSESAEGRGKCLESHKERGGRRAHDVHRGRAAGDAGGHKAGIPRILPPKVPGPRREERALRGEEEGRAGRIGRFKSVYPAGSEAEAKARLGPFAAKWSRTYPSFRKHPTEPGPFPFCRFPKAVWRPLYASNAAEAFRACPKRKLRARLALHSPKNGRCLIAVEAERCNRSGRNRRLTGFDELTADEAKTLGMERQK